MSDRRLIERFRTWSAAGAPLVLGTVISTAGSTYTKPGQRILIGADGGHEGLISGGCLEGDLAAHAGAVLADGETRIITYDLRDEADAVWGLGIGCNGLLQVLLQRLTPAQGYAPLQTLCAWQWDAMGFSCGLVTASTDPATSPGATLLARGDETVAFGLDRTRQAALAQAMQAGPTATGMQRLAAPGGSLEVLVTRVRPVPRVLVLGAGPDAIPLVRLADALGWRVTVADHRAARLAAPGLALAETRLELRPAQLAEVLDLAPFAAAVVMSHHLESDHHYLAALAASRVPYVGLLGPRDRRRRLLTELGRAGEPLGARLHGPVGLDIGADSPETIALAIVAEIQQCLAGPRGHDHAT